ncbi:MAG: late competence development ComFB family protein [Pseudanabaena sp. ELA607]
MGICHNALEELVIAEAESQYKRLGAEAKNRVDLSEVIAYALNRLPTMYATTQRGWNQQRLRAHKELGETIAKTLKNGFISTQRDTLRKLDPLPTHEVMTPSRALAKLQSILHRDQLKWAEVPEAVRQAIEQAVSPDTSSRGTAYQNVERRHALAVRTYATRRPNRANSPDGPKSSLKFDPNENQFSQAAQDEREFSTYMMGANYRYSNIMENLVLGIAERRLQRLTPDIAAQIQIEDIVSYALNRLPPMYATSRRGMHQLREQVKAEMTNQVITVIKEAIAKILQTPGRVLAPLPFDRFNMELNIAIEQLQAYFKDDQISWRNVGDYVEKAMLRSLYKRTYWQDDQDHGSLRG